MVSSMTLTLETQVVRLCTCVCLLLVLVVLAACTSDFDKELREHQNLILETQDAEERAQKAYIAKQWATAQSGFRDLIALYHRSLQSKRLSQPEREATQYQVVVAYGRLAKAYRESGDPGKAQEALRVGLTNVPLSMRPRLQTQSDIEELTTSLDKNLMR